MSNQMRYPSNPVGYSQFSPLAAAGIRQVRSTRRDHLTLFFLPLSLGQWITFPRYGLVQQEPLVVPRRSYLHASLYRLNSVRVRVYLTFFTVNIFSLCVHVCAILLSE